jgi:transcriptional regulator with XRE-family HTH domain
MAIEDGKQSNRQAFALLDSIQIDMDRLQAEKQRKLPHLTDAQFAELLGVKPATYSDYKNSKQAKPSLQVAIRASLLLDFDLRLLVPQAAALTEFFSQNLR